MFLNQLSGEVGLGAHSQQLAEEILEQMDGKLDFCFLPSSSYGTVVGLSRRFADKSPGTKVVGVRTERTTLTKPKEPCKDKKEPAAEDASQAEVPPLPDCGVASAQVTVTNEEMILTSRSIILEESLFASATSGEALAGALKYLKAEKLSERPELRCVVIFPDSARNYSSNLMDDNLMILSRPADSNHPLAQRTVKDLTWLSPLPYYDKRLTISDCCEIFKEGMPLIPIRESGEVVGVVTQDSLLTAVTTKALNSKSSCQHCIVKQYPWLPADAPLQAVQSLLGSASGIVLIARNDKGRVSTVYVVGKRDIMDYMSIGMKDYI